MVKYLFLALCINIFIQSQQAHAGAFAFQTGATSIGSGGPNSMGIPPRATDVGVTYIHKSMYEVNLNLMGLTIAKRHYSKWGGILGLGAGLIISGNGAGPGLTSLFGYEFFRTKGGYALSMEYAQSTAISFTGHIISPYIVRLGFTKWF